MNRAENMNRGMAGAAPITDLDIPPRVKVSSDEGRSASISPRPIDWLRLTGGRSNSFPFVVAHPGPDSFL